VPKEDEQGEATVPSGSVARADCGSSGLVPLEPCLHQKTWRAKLAEPAIITTGAKMVRHCGVCAPVRAPAMQRRLATGQSKLVCSVCTMDNMPTMSDALALRTGSGFNAAPKHASIMPSGALPIFVIASV